MKKSISKIVEGSSIWGVNTLIDKKNDASILCGKWVSDHLGECKYNKKYKLSIVRNDTDGFIKLSRCKDVEEIYHYDSYRYYWDYSKGKSKWKDKTLFVGLEEMIEAMFKVNEKSITVDFYLEEI